jgi:hypothetical protein
MGKHLKSAGWSRTEQNAITFGNKALSDLGRLRIWWIETKRSLLCRGVRAVMIREDIRARGCGTEHERKTAPLETKGAAPTENQLTPDSSSSKSHALGVTTIAKEQRQKGLSH